LLPEAISKRFRLFASEGKHRQEFFDLRPSCGGLPTRGPEVSGGDVIYFRTAAEFRPPELLPKAFGGALSEFRSFEATHTCRPNGGGNGFRTMMVPGAKSSGP